MQRNDYYPGGMTQPGRKFTQAGSGYKYGFNGKEKADEIYGEGNNYDFGNRMYNASLGRWFSLDHKENIGWSSYNFAVDNPIRYMDKEGDIQRDPNGKIIFTPIAQMSFLGVANAKELRKRFDGGGSQSFVGVQCGYIWTDKGNPILVYKVIGDVKSDEYSVLQSDNTTKIKYNQGKTHIEPLEPNSILKTNCYARALADGEYWMEDTNDGYGSMKILADEYKLVKSGNVSKNFKFQYGDVIDLGSVENGKLSYGSHYIKATGEVNSKGQAIFESQFAFDDAGLMTGTFDEIKAHLDKDVPGAPSYNLKDANIYRYNPKGIKIPNKLTPESVYKSEEGKATEKELTPQIQNLENDY